MRCSNCGSDSPEGFRFCGACGRPLAVSSPATTETSELFSAERRFLTVMFCDIVDSTLLSDRMDPEQTHELIEEYHRITGALIERHGGSIAQYLGDGLLVYFGYPVAVGNDAERAVRSALEIVDAFRELKPTVALPDGLTLRVRIGIHSGAVVTAELGKGERSDRLALGGTPNIAARLESIAGPNDVAVSAVTRSLTASRFDYEELGAHQLKGVRDPMQVYRPLREARGFEALQDRRAQLVGRQPQLDRLSESFARASAGGRVVVRVRGVPGIGKTRLLAEFEHLMAADAPGPIVLTTRCESEGHRTFLAPFEQLLRDRLNIEPLHPAEAQLGRLAEELSLDAAALDGPLLSAFAALLRLRRDNNEPWLQGRPEDQQQVIFDALLGWLRSLTASGPLVLVLDDFFNADASSRALVSHLEQLPSLERFMLVLVERVDGRAVRPEVLPGQVVVDVPALSADEARRVVLDLNDGISDATVRAVLERAEGVPLFLEELARFAGGDLGEEIADRLQYIFGPKLDRLGSAKHTASIAGIIGRVFDVRLLEHVSELAPAQLKADLEVLLREDVVAPLERSGHYEFRHSLLLDAIMANLLRRSRRVLHGRVATALEREFPLEAGNRPELIARHWGGAGEVHRALPYFTRAAEDSRAVYANAEAITLYQEALELAAQVASDDAGDLSELLPDLSEGLGDVYALLRLHEEATLAFSETLDTLGSRDRVRRARLHRKIGMSNRDQAPFGLPSMQEALAVLGDAPGADDDSRWRQEWVQIRFELAINHYGRGNVAEMVAISDELEPFVRDHGSAHQQAEFANQMLLVDQWQSRFSATSRSLRFAHQFVDAAERSGDLPLLAAACQSLGTLKMGSGEFLESEALLERALALCEECGYRSAQVRALVYYALVKRRMGELQEAVAISQRAAELAEPARMLMYVHTHEGMLAWQAYRRGELEEAAKLSQRALDGWQRIEARYPFRWIASLPLLAVAVDRRDAAQVELLLEQITATTQQRLHPEVDVALERARRDLQGGSAEEAVRLAKTHGYL